MAPGFVVDDPATWTYKIKASHDEHVRPGIPPENAYGSILAYRERFQNGLITGAENNLDDLILYASVRNTPPGTDVEVDAGTDESESIKLNLLRIDDGRVLVTLSKL